MNLALGANREGKERVKSDASRIQSSRIGSALVYVAAGVRNGPCLGWSVRFSGFPLLDSYGNLGDRFLATGDEITAKSGWRARMNEVLPK